MNRIKPAVLFYVCITFCALTCAFPASAQNRPQIGPQRGGTLKHVTPATAVIAFDAYIQKNGCKNNNVSECLEEMQIKTCRSGCWRKGYNYRVDVKKPRRLDIHMSLGYLRKLRNLVDLELSRGEKAIGQYTFGMTLNDLLYSQVQMMLRQPAIKFKYAFNGKVWRTMNIRNVISGKTIDPDKFAGVVWVNGADTAHAMTQADAMRWFVSVGQILASRGQGPTAEYYLKMGARFFTSFSIPHRFGGIRNNKTRFKCHGDKYCYFFHSQEVHDYPFPSSIINKDIYAIRDLAVTAHLLKHWEQFGSCACSSTSCAKGFRNQSMKGGTRFTCDKPGDAFPASAKASKSKRSLTDQMIESARGGLFNLAYGPGNKSSGRSYRIPPPNLKDFIVRMYSNKTRTYFRSSYGYWLDTYSPKHRRGPADITAKNNCHYHYLTLKLFYEVLELTENSAYFLSDRDFTDARHCLLYGRHPGTSYKPGQCFVARQGLGNVSDVPLAEFYLSGRTAGLPYHVDHERCTGSSSAFLFGLSPARTWYDQKYSKSTF